MIKLSHAATVELAEYLDVDPIAVVNAFNEFNDLQVSTFLTNGNKIDLIKRLHEIWGEANHGLSPFKP